MAFRNELDHEFSIDAKLGTDWVLRIPALYKIYLGGQLGTKTLFMGMDYTIPLINNSSGFNLAATGSFVGAVNEEESKTENDEGNLGAGTFQFSIEMTLPLGNPTRRLHVVYAPSRVTHYLSKRKSTIQQFAVFLELPMFSNIF